MPGGTGALVREPVPSGFGILETTPAPPAIGVLGSQTWNPFNNSGILANSAKQATKPLSLWETFGYTEHLSDEDGWSVERYYVCNWSDALASMQWLKGYSIATAGGISRNIPAQDPYRPWMYCVKAELVEAMGVPLQDPGMPIPATIWAEKSAVGGLTTFSDGVAKIRATYRAVPYVIRDDVQQANSQDALVAGELTRYVERIPRYAIQGLQLVNIVAQNKLIFYSPITAPALNGTPVPDAGIFLMPTQSWHYIWHDVPFYPSAAIEAVVGRVNASPFDGVAGWPLFPAQTLLCQAPEIHMRRNVIGQAAFDVTWILDYRPDGWNAYKTAQNGFQLATFGGKAPAADGSNLVYRPIDFGQLFAASGNQILFR